jgi:hypothetical protein
MTICVAVQHGFVQLGGLAQVNQQIQRLWSSPCPVIYQFPALTASGPGAWHFGFFALTNGFPEDLITGREQALLRCAKLGQAGSLT